MRVTWETYKEYFSYSKYGIWSLGLLVLYHFIINLNNMAVGLYLAFTLTTSFSATESPGSYNLILTLIMISSIATSFFGKYLSNKIVRLHHSKPTVHGDKLTSARQDGLERVEHQTQVLRREHTRNDSESLLEGCGHPRQDSLHVHRRD